MRLILRVLGLCVLLAISAVPAAFKPGSITCPASGAKVLASASTKMTWINFQAPGGNAGAVFVGDSTVTAAANCAPGKGACMLAGGTFFAPALSNTQPYDLAQTYIACTNANDSLIYLGLQ